MALISAYEAAGDYKYNELAIEFSRNLKDIKGYIFDSPSKLLDLLRAKALLKLSLFTEEINRGFPIFISEKLKLYLQQGG